MRKNYTKPVIAFENFELSTNIAGSCNVQGGNMAQGSCAYEIAGRQLFVSGSGACTTTVPDGSYGVCYYVPTYDSMVFHS